MKDNKVFVLAILSVMLCAGVQAVPDSVKVSDFGYDPTDSTEFIRKALASGAKKVTLDRQAGPWYTLPLKMPSNIEFVLEPGVELVAKRGEFRHKRDYLVELYGVTNVTLRGGEGSAFRMWKCDYQKPPYEKSEWRYALRIVRSRNVLVEGLKFLQSGGDGIGVSGDDITIRRCVCDGNHRQGMSVFSVKNLLVEDTVLSNTKGTPPQAGLDIEPDLASESLRNVVFRNCTSFRNAGNGFETYLVQLNKKSGPVDITFENCRSWGNSNDAIITCDNRKGQEHVTGRIRYLNCKFGPSRHANVKLAAIPANSVDVQFADTVLTNASKSSAVQIAVSNPRYGRPCGLDFGNLTVYDDGEWFKCAGEGMGKEVDVRGDVTVISSNGVRRSERIDVAWMDRYLPVFDNGRPLPDVVKMPSIDDIKVCDACPGELAETEPFTILYQTPVVFFAEKPGPCRFMVRQVNAVPGRKLATEPLIIVPEGGGKQTRIPAPSDKSTEVVFHAKSRGFYRILPPKWGTRLRIDSTAVPMGIDVRSGKCVVAPLGGKRFSLSFASSGEPFTFVAQGGDYYRFKVDMFDADGKHCESDDIVDGQFIAHGEKGDVPGFRKAVFSRAKKPCYDHIKVRLYGGGGFFFISESKRWR